MTITTVGIMSPGDMGHSVGEVLGQHELRVLTCLQGRSERTRELAAEAGFEDTPSLEALVEASDAMLCILVPGSALSMAEQVAGAMRTTGATLLYVDCNAIAPQTARAAAQAIIGAGGRFADAGIIGPPPRNPGSRFYTSGPGAAEFAELGLHGLDIRVLEGDVGKASGLKMCYAALTKGLQALGTELMVAAKAMDLEAELKAEHEGGMAPIRKYIERAMLNTPSKAHRWVSEMEEIAATFEYLGLTPRLFQGVADMYRFIASTPMGKETPENRDRDRESDGLVAGLVEALEKPTAASRA